MSQDHELKLFSTAMDILVDASQIIIDPFTKDHFLCSVGLQGYGTIDTFERLAGALNYRGYRTKRGKYITGDNLKKMKSNLVKKYGDRFVMELVDWTRVGSRYFPSQNPYRKKCFHPKQGFSD